MCSQHPLLWIRDLANVLTPRLQAKCFPYQKPKIYSGNTWENKMANEDFFKASSLGHQASRLKFFHLRWADHLGHMQKSIVSHPPTSWCTVGRNLSPWKTLSQF